MAEKLKSGDSFPQVKLDLVGGGSITLPDDIPTDFAAILFYRGHW